VVLTFVVLGAQGAGKSYFIRNSFDLRKSVGSPISSSKVSLSGNLYRVRLIELAFDDADFSGRSVVLPKYLNGVAVPSIDGAFCLYDVTDPESVANVPQALGMYDQRPARIAERIELPLTSSPRISITLRYPINSGRLQDRRLSRSLGGIAAIRRTGPTLICDSLDR
jgi:hypothetical protein